MPGVEALRNVAIFGGVRDDVLELLLDRAVPVEVESGDWFFQQGDRGTSAFLLVSGRASVHRRLGERVFHLGDVQPGACFGEVALVDFCPRSASIRVEERARALEITTADLLAVRELDLEQFTLIHMNMARELARKLRTVDERLLELGALDPETSFRT